MQLLPPWWGTWASGLLLRWQLRLGMYSVGFFFFFFPSWLCCPLRFQNSPQTHRRVSYCGNFSSFTTSSPGCWLLFLFFFFSILSYLLLKRMGCLYGCLVSSLRVQKLFCGSCSAFKRSFDEFVGEKVVSCPIPSPSWDRPAVFFMGQQICVCVVKYNKKTENWKH